jgi:hypothetical protein
MNNVMKQAQRFVENIWPRAGRSPDCRYDERMDREDATLFAEGPHQKSTVERCGTAMHAWWHV